MALKLQHITDDLLLTVYFVTTTGSCMRTVFIFFFFFNDTATTEIYTLSLHDALPIYLYIVVCKDSVPSYNQSTASHCR